MQYRTIMLKDYSSIFEEILTSGIVTPGMLVETDTDGYVLAHSTAGGNTERMFAVQDQMQGKTINDNYASGVKAQVWIPGRGDQVFAILVDGGTAVPIGGLLESAGGGFLQLHVADVESFESNEAGELTVLPNQIVGMALEALDLSDSSGAEESSATVGYNKRIRIRII